MWRTTRKLQSPHTIFDDFNPRPPCGGRQGQLTEANKQLEISIHVPRVEDDDFFFYSLGKTLISIHVPRVEDDAPFDFEK